MKLLFVVILLLFSTSCSYFGKNSERVVKGHISVGSAFKYITLLDEDVTYFADSGSETKNINDWIAKQPVRSNPFVGDYAGCRSVYLQATVTENLITLPMQGTYKTLRIEKIFEIDHPHIDFLNSKKHPLPHPVTE
jgi:hypothetical protein